MTLGVTQLTKPHQATWDAKSVAHADGHVGVAPLPDEADSDAFPAVEVAWYGPDRAKVTLRGFGPAQIRQAYLTGVGRDVILDVVRVTE